MKIIKRLLSYVGMMVIIACVLAVIYFRVELFPTHINKPIDTALIKIGDMLDVEIPSYKPEADGSADDEGHKVAVISEVAQAPAEDVEPEINEDPDAGIVTAITGPVTETITNTVEKLADMSDVSLDTELADSRKMLVHARKAFWDGNMEEAEKVYRGLTENEELDPNAYGELGNVYYAQGKWQEAGRAYYEAAVRLIELKQPYQVNYLLRVIQGLDSESAEKLRLKISG